MALGEHLRPIGGLGTAPGPSWAAPTWRALSNGATNDASSPKPSTLRQGKAASLGLEKSLKSQKLTFRAIVESALCASTKRGGK